MQLAAAMYGSGKAVATSDTVPISCRGIYVGGTGDVSIQFGPPGANMAAVVFKAVPVGTILPIELNQGFIMATNTTATLLVALV